MPLYRSKYRSPVFLFNKHLQTVIPFFYVKPDNTLYQTEKMELPDGDFLELDWIRGGNDKVLVINHGLEGNSRSSYVQQMANHFKKLGWDILAMHTRGCGRELNRLPIMYHGGATEEINHLVNQVSKEYSKVVLAGFSLGANMFINYVAKHETPSNVLALAAFSAPLDLRGSEKKMDKLINHFYAQKFLFKLKKKLRKLGAKHPGTIDLIALDKINSMQEFAKHFAATYSGFGNIDDYYAASSALESLKDIKMPTLLVNAKNDPFLTKASYPTQFAALSPYIHLDIPSNGGHAAFPINKTDSWIPLRLEIFLKEQQLA